MKGHVVFSYIILQFILSTIFDFSHFHIKEKKKKKKKTEKWGSGVNCEEGMREKKMRWVRGMYVCGGREEKRKAVGYMGGGKKKRKEKRKAVGYMGSGKKKKIKKERQWGTWVVGKKRK
jgi:hypothetical protein